jgi:hypothetical protein
VLPPSRRDFPPRQDRDFDHQRNGRRHRRHRGRGRRTGEQHFPPTPVTPDSETVGWFDPSRDGGFIRRAAGSYLPEPGDAWIPPHIVRQHALRQGTRSSPSRGMTIAIATSSARSRRSTTPIRRHWVDALTSSPSPPRILNDGSRWKRAGRREGARS